MSVTRALSYYQILRIPQDASGDQIERAYRDGLAEVRAGLKRGGPLQHRLLDALREAYGVLGDAARRQAYDRARGRLRDAGLASKEASASNLPLLRFKFTGSGGEYFRIWIVDLILSLLTLGIYSAWAQSRRERYFHRHTLLAGTAFDYHGNPRAILMERGFICGFLLLVVGAYQFIAVAYGAATFAVLLLCAFAVAPWSVLRSLKLKAAGTTYRGLRLQHRGTFGQALEAISGNSLLLLPTFGVWLPMWIRAMMRYRIDKLAFGDTDFSCSPSAAGFFRTFLIAGVLLLAAVMAAMISVIASSTHGPLPREQMLAVAALGLLFLVLVILPFLRVRTANLTWNGTRLGRYRFVSKQAFASFWPLHATHLVLIVATMGLYWPWARVREAAYHARHVALRADDLDNFIADAKRRAWRSAEVP